MVQVEKRISSIGVNKTLVTAAASEALAVANAVGDLTVVLTDDAQLQELNLRYLHIDAPTDVLSFPSGERDPESGVTYLGDVIISVPRARAQAAAAGHALEAELRLLVVHGVLHLLGYDHANADDKRRMWSQQDRALGNLGAAGISTHD